MKNDSPSFALGLFSAFAVAAIWSGFIVVSRIGAQSELTIYDIAGLRFAFIGTLTLPFAIKYWPRHFNWKQVLILAGGTGVPYCLLAYGGFVFAPTAHGGVFINGALPIFTTLLALVWFKTRPNTMTTLAIFVLAGGCALTAFAQQGIRFDESLIGDGLFLSAALVMSVYMLATRAWKLNVKELIAVVPFTNAVLYVPIWLLFLPTNLSTAPMDDILLQMFYQGLGPSLGGLLFLFLATKHIGPTPTSAVLAGVPAIAALMGIPLLGETPVLFEWIGMGLVTFGILLTLIAKRRAE